MHSSKKDYETFCHCSLFEGLNKEELKALYAISNEVSVKKGDYLIHEGEKSSEFFIILEGSLQVIKNDNETQTSYLIDTLSKGDTVGEVAFLARGNRTASVQAKNNCRLRSVPIDNFIALLERDKNLIKVFYRLAEAVSQRVHSANDLALQALKRKVVEYKTRSKMGVFLICIIAILSLFSIAVPGLRYLMTIAPNSSYIGLPLTLIFAIILYFLIKSFQIPMSELGITKKNAKRSLIEGLIYAIPLSAAVGFLVKWSEMHISPYFAQRPFFDFFALIQNPDDQTWANWIQLNLLYCFFIIPLQEIMARGCLQGLLEKFLISKHRVILSILASNLIFSSLHVIFSVYFTFGVFFSGCIIGWLYSRTHNLLGCIVAHCIAGVFGLSILGVTGPLS